MKKLVAKLDRIFYPAHGNNWDDELLRQRVLSLLQPSHAVLDLGAGAGIVAQMNFRGRAELVCGVDLDQRVLENPYLDEGRVSDAGRIPYENEKFDLVFSDNVLEHLSEPGVVFQEVARTLKPGGIFVFKTPNKWHYMPIIARLTPHWFHQYVNRLRGRAEVDTFPTQYKANSRGDVARLAGLAGLELVDLALIEGRPEYLRMTVPTYLVGILFERAVNATKWLAPFRVVLIGVLRKP